MVSDCDDFKISVFRILVVYQTSRRRMPRRQPSSDLHLFSCRSLYISKFCVRMLLLAYLLSSVLRNSQLFVLFCFLFLCLTPAITLWLLNKIQYSVTTTFRIKTLFPSSVNGVRSIPSDRMGQTSYSARNSI